MKKKQTLSEAVHASPKGKGDGGQGEGTDTVQGCPSKS